MTSNSLDAIQDQISQGNLQQAIQLLREYVAPRQTKYVRELTVHAASIRKLSEDERLGIEAPEVLRRERQRITLALTELTQVLDQEMLPSANEESDSLSLRLELRKLLKQGFDKPELKQLCFDMGISHENLASNKAEMIIDLIEYCERHQRVDELMTKLRQDRPELF